MFVLMKQCIGAWIAFSVFGARYNNVDFEGKQLNHTNILTGKQEITFSVKTDVLFNNILVVGG